MRLVQKRRCSFLRKCVRRIFWKCPSTIRITAVFYRRRGYSTVEDGKIFWEAPIGITIWTKDGPVAGLAVEFWNDTLCIRQLQGVRGARAPEDLKMWPQLFVSACMLFAKHAGIKRVRLYRADQSLFYSFPDLREIPEERWESEIKDIRNRMRRRYDGTARQMGFAMKRRWGEWKPRE